MKQFLTAKDISGIMGVGESLAYRYIREMNAELKEQGYLTTRGKIPAAYFATKYYGFQMKESE